MSARSGFEIPENEMTVEQMRERSEAAEMDYAMRTCAEWKPIRESLISLNREYINFRWGLTKILNWQTAGSVAAIVLSVTAILLLLLTR